MEFCGYETGDEAGEAGAEWVSLGYVEGMAEYGNLRIQLVQPRTPEAGNCWFWDLRSMSALAARGSHVLFSTYRYTAEESENNDDGWIQELDSSR